MRQGGFETLLLSSGDVADRQPGDPVRVLGYWQPCTALNVANTRGIRGDLIVLDNRPRDRVPGYQVFAPLYLHDDSVALIFRGWMPALDRRENLSSQLAQTSEWRGNAGLLSNGVARVTSGAIAEAQERACDASRQLVPVQGTLWKPDRRPLGSFSPDIRDTVPRVVVMQELQTDWLGDFLRTEVAPLVVWPKDGQERRQLEYLPLPAVSVITPDTHKGYALTWAAIAATIMVIAIALGVQRRATEERS